MTDSRLTPWNGRTGVVLHAARIVLHLLHAARVVLHLLHAARVVLHAALLPRLRHQAVGCRETEIQLAEHLIEVVVADAFFLLEAIDRFVGLGTEVAVSGHAAAG